METIHRLNPPKFPVYFPVVPNLIGHALTLPRRTKCRLFGHVTNKFAYFPLYLGDNQVYFAEEQAT